MENITVSSNSNTLVFGTTSTEWTVNIPQGTFTPGEYMCDFSFWTNGYAGAGALQVSSEYITRHLTTRSNKSKWTTVVLWSTLIRTTFLTGKCYFSAPPQMLTFRIVNQSNGLVYTALSSNKTVVMQFTKL